MRKPKTTIAQVNEYTETPNPSVLTPSNDPVEKDDEQTPLLDRVGDSFLEIGDSITDAAEYTQDVIEDFWEDFRTFIKTGPLLQMAVGIVIGNGVTSVLDSLVQDIMVPPLSILSKSGIALRNYYWVISKGVHGGPYATLADAKADGAVTENYGVFIAKLIDFAITSFALFWIVKAFQALKRVLTESSPAEAPVNQKKCAWCCSMIDIEAFKCPFVSSVN